MRQILIIILFSILFINNTFCQQDLNVLIQELNDNQIDFHHLTTKEGLSASIILCTFVDKQGVMWIGTSHGLNRFNGNKIDVFLNDPGDKNSISNNYIHHITQDSKGFLWVSTKNGLNKFNPKTETFISYLNIQEDDKSISSNSVNETYEDLYGNIWIATKNGLDKFNPADSINIFKHFFLGQTVRTFIIDKRGKMWVGTVDGLYLFNMKNYQEISFKNLPNNSYSISNNSITSIYEDRENNIWIGTNGGGLNKLKIENLKKEKILFTQYNPDQKNPYSIQSDMIFKITQDFEGNIWLASVDKGLIKLDVKTEKFTNFVADKDNPNSILSNNIFTVYTDNSGTIWIGSKDGIDIINLQRKKFAKINALTKNVDGVTTNQIWLIYYDKSNRLWIGPKGECLNLIQLDSIGKNSSKHLLSEIRKSQISTSTAISMYEDNSHNLWIGTLKGLFRIEQKSETDVIIHEYNYEQDSLSNNVIWSILQDKFGNMWFGSKNGLNRLDKSMINNSSNHVKFDSFLNDLNDSTSICGNEIWSLVDDNYGNIFIGSHDFGLSKLSVDLIDKQKKDIKFTNYSYSPDNLNSLSSNNINTISVDKHNNIWVGTNGGLNRLTIDPKDNSIKVRRFLTKDGLPDNKICGILESKTGDIWTSTKRGLSKISYKTSDDITSEFNIQNFTPYDGLQGFEFNVQAAYKSTNDIMIFGGTNGINIFYADSINNNKYVPPIEISHLKIINKDVKLLKTIVLNKKETSNSSEIRLDNGQYYLPSIIPYTKKIILNYSDYLLEFEFSSLSFLNSDQIEYAYKMENFDQDWIYIRNRRFATYSNLPAGDYIFRVKSSNSDGIWNDKGTSIIVIIKPAWWNTWIFRISIFIFVILLFVLYIKRREKKIIQHRDFLEKTVKERTKEVVEQKKSIENKNTELNKLITEVVTQKNNLETQKQIIETIHEEQTSSIRYAQRIQKAVLPSSEYLQTMFSNHFVLFKPHSLVSGDFYWATQIREYVIITAADCTGHGVPGAFMSMLGISYISEIVRKKEIVKASQVLDELRSTIIQSLHQKGVALEQKDGMDIALCVINTKTNILQYSGANNPLYIVRNILKSPETSNITIDNKSYNLEITKDILPEIKVFFTKEDEGNVLIEIKSDKMPIAHYEQMNPFTNYEIQLTKDDSIYMFSDGYADQFGGESGKKFKYKAFKQMLIKNSNKPMEEQKEILNTTFEKWKGKCDQVDDVVVIGIKI